MSRSGSNFRYTPLGSEERMNTWSGRPLGDDIGRDSYSNARTSWDGSFDNATVKREEDQTNPIWNRRNNSALVSKKYIMDDLLKNATVKREKDQIDSIWDLPMTGAPGDRENERDYVPEYDEYLPKPIGSERKTTKTNSEVFGRPKVGNSQYSIWQQVNYIMILSGS